MITNIRHFAIEVKNMRKALHFYRDFLKLKVIKTKLEEGKYITTLLGLQHCKLHTVKLGITKDSLPSIELYQFEDNNSATKGDFHHISFTVEDIKILRMLLLGKGIKPISEPQIDEEKKHLVMLIRDYDQNLLEFVENIIPEKD